MITINPDLLSPCGLHCAVCAVYIAHRDNNEKFKERLLHVFQGKVHGKGKLPNADGLTIADIHCCGCLSDDPVMHC